MSSESNFEPSDSPSLHASADQNSEDDLRRTSRRATSEALSSPRKRRRQSRSKSVDLLLNSKRHLKGKYNDAYRILFNGVVKDAVNRFDFDTAHPLRAAQIGASKWTSEEKSTLFAALERLGRDDLPGIANAVQTKSIPEIRDFLLLLHDATLEQGNPGVSLRDIPAAAELSPDCCQRLELASDKLSWYQETSEAKAEQDRYGPYWLITTELAEEIEVAWNKSNRRSSSPFSSSPVQQKDDVSETKLNKDQSSPQPSNSRSSELLESVPSSTLLKPSAFLTLSMNLFMNSSSSPPSGDPHWTKLVTPLASGPSIYHTALNDFQTLAVSVTKRLAQSSIIQATSRLRAHTWRSNDKVAKPFVKKRDVQAAIDMLGLQRDRSKKFAGVARRCGVRVFDGAGKTKRELEYDEVKELLSLPKRSKVGADTDQETDIEGFTTDAEEFPARAYRAATPLPTEGLVHSEDEAENEAEKEAQQEAEEVTDDELESEFEVSLSEAGDLSESSTASSPNAAPKTSRHALSEVAFTEMLEAHDQKAGFEEETRIYALLGFPAPVKDLPNTEDSRYLYTADHKTETENWRDWTEYRAEWEVLPSPVPSSLFLSNHKKLENIRKQAAADAISNAELASGGAGMDKRTREREIPTRSVRAYAALQEQKSSSFQAVDDDDDDEGGEYLIEEVRPSVEDGAASGTDNALWDADEGEEMDY